MAESAHPINSVAGQSALLRQILELQIAEDGDSPSTSDHAFSASTRQALLQSTLFKATETGDGRPVVDAGSYFRSVLAGAVKNSSDNTAYERPEVSLLRTIVQSDVGRVRPLSGTEPRTLEDEALARVVASPDLTEMLAEAARLVSVVTPGQRRVDARHALVASLKSLPAQQVIWTDRLSAEQPTFVFDRIRSALTEAFEKNAQQSSKVQERSDNLNAWSSEIAAIVPSPDLRLPEPERRSDTHYVRDAPARTLTEDRLGLSTEVRALAEVICLRDPGPPLAIGLFGDWGSGKSTYMNLIEAAIDELTANAKADDAVRSVFVEGVVHIKFNAWHYNDADLWSSLTSEFFRQLRVGGHAERAEDDYSGLVRQVAERIAKTEEAADAEGIDLTSKRIAAKAVRSRIEELDRSAGALRVDALLKAARATLEGLSEKDSQQFSDLLGILGYDVAPSDVVQKTDALMLEAEKALATHGRASATFRGVLNAAVGRGGAVARRVYKALALGILLVVCLIGLQLWLPALFGGGIAALLGFVSIVGASGAAVVNVYKSIEPVFRTANDFALKLAAEKRKTEEERDRQSAELQKLDNEIAEIEERRQTLLTDVARFRGLAPEQVLDFFLRESETTRSFDASLGIISRVRRAFDQLDAIFEEASRANSPRPPSVGFDRIVLYIDDLDRCQAQQVVHVLEAVHLLLAFPLFVVVVGVDARWLEQSLLEYYKEKIIDTDGADPAPDTKTDRPLAKGQATVHDFLEKIFQIPIRLRGLSSLSPETYASYIRQAAGPVSYPEDQGAGGSDASDNRGRTEIRPVEVDILPIEFAAGAAPEQVRLTRAEVELIERLGPIVGKTPRAVKRFVNLYRLVRGMRRGTHLDAFLGPKVSSQATQLVKPYAAYQFWLAVDIGLPVEQARRLRSAVRSLGISDVAAVALLEPLDVPSDPDSIAEVLLKTPSETTETRCEELLAFWEAISPTSRKSVYKALHFAIEQLPGPSGTRELKAALEETRRFSSERE